MLVCACVDVMCLLSMLMCDVDADVDADADAVTRVRLYSTPVARNVETLARIKQLKHELLGTCLLRSCVMACACGGWRRMEMARVNMSPCHHVHVVASGSRPA